VAPRRVHVAATPPLQAVVTRHSHAVGSPARVLIAGGGVAGLETLLALRALAGDRLDITILAPELEFVNSLDVRGPALRDAARAWPSRRKISKRRRPTSSLARASKSIRRDGPAGAYLQEHRVKPVDFNSYGSRRGNHEVMVRGTFANVRLRNLLTGGWGPLPEGGMTRHLPDGEQLSIHEAAVRYAQEGVPLVALGGKEYGSGSSRDWAAKGTLLLGVRAVIAESFERIHRSNLVGMGVLPLQFADGESVASVGLNGEEEYSISGVADSLNAGELPREATVRAGEREFTVGVRIDTPKVAEYFRHGGILQYVLRQLLTHTASAVTQQGTERW
jgi:Aconitase C-terminal domain